MEDGGHLQIQGEPNPEAAINRREIIQEVSKTCTYMYKTIVKFAIGIFILVVCNVLVVRTLTLAIIPLLELMVENPCLPNSTSTAKITSMVYNSSSGYIRRLSVFMMIIITVLQWPAHGYLFYYLYKFFARKYPAWQQAYQVDNGEYKWASFICRQHCKGALVILSLSVLTIAFMITIAGDIVKLATEQVSFDCEYPTLHARRIVTYVYYTTTFFTHMLEVVERYLMVCFTAFVGAMWHDGYETRKKEMERAPPNPPNNAQLQITNGYVDEFKKIVECAKPIYKIFRSFFVFQWLVHVYLLFTQLVHLLYPWFKDGRSSFPNTTESNMTTVTFHSNTAAIIFYTLALLIAYVCGLKMNSYRRRYIRKAELTQKQLLKHDRENKSIFTPRVPGTGLSISLESPGYMLGVVITMFGLVGALLAM